MFRLRFLIASCVLRLGLSASIAGAVQTNTGVDEPVVHSENVITPRVDAGPPKVLYMPASSDDPAYRAAIAAITGGAVDFFDPVIATPGLGFLLGYTCVYTWPNTDYADRVALGNVLADYVDNGGKVILGGFCTYTTGSPLGGRIMTADYCPVRSPGGTNHFMNAAYSGNGTAYIHRNVTAYSDANRDFLVLQGLGVKDGTYADGEIATAYRGDGRVMYLNAVGPTFGGSGDFARMVANFALWTMPGGALHGCDRDGQLFGLNLRTGHGGLVGQLPMASVGEIEYDDATGAAYCQGSDGVFSIQPFAVGTGAALGAAVPDAGSFAALESITGSWYGCFHSVVCGASQIASINPATGATLFGPVLTGVGPISGMAWNSPLARMYYVTGAGGACGGTSTLYWNSSLGNPLNLVGPVGFNAGSLEWGPDDNLYGGSTGGPGVLYRISPTTGVAVAIGPTGFDQMTGLMLVSGANTVAVGDFGGAKLTGLALGAAIPNPSRIAVAVTLRFSLSRPGSARIALYDVAGRRIWSRDATNLDAGEHAWTWDGRGDGGEFVPAGMYFARLMTDEGVREGKLIRL